MLFQQDDKLCKQGIKSFEQHTKSSEQVKNKTRMSLPGFRTICSVLNCAVIYYFYSTKIAYFYGMLNVALFDLFTLLFYLFYLYLQKVYSILSLYIIILYILSISIQCPFISIVYFSIYILYLIICIH